ncbi:MAG: hypothetical protein ACT4PP_12390 [Sporichthyaceae bacterium]
MNASVETTNATTAGTIRPWRRRLAALALAAAGVAALSACQTEQLGADGESFTRQDVEQAVTNDVADVLEQGAVATQEIVDELRAELGTEQASHDGLGSASEGPREVQIETDNLSDDEIAAAIIDAVENS